jgi:8-oxo-dGTP pyrophosphatase MutT (NUDIX family)
MADDLDRFLSRLAPSVRKDVAWFGGAMELQLQVFITTELPPLEYITSVRAVLFEAGRCAVLSNIDGRHVLPGGRRDGEESIEAALRREILEETGCTVTSVEALGILHFHHMTPKPVDYKYPYPDFVQALMVARATRCDSFAGDPEHYETGVEFVMPAELERMAIPDYQRLLVAEALSRFA